MRKAALFLLLAAPVLITGCSSYNIGSKNDTDPNGSYSGYTMNSPVTDQNPYVGGAGSYPSSTSAGKPLATQDKLDGR
jgi:hypothetical protein